MRDPQQIPPQPESPGRTRDGALPALFIGGGNMASAIIKGALRAGVLASHTTVVAEPDEGRRKSLASIGVVTAPDTSRALGSLGQVEAATRRTGAVVFAVKPQVLGEVVRSAPELSGMSGRLAVSIMAGVTRERLRGVIGGGWRVSRVMPNLPISVGKGMTAIVDEGDLASEESAWVERLFGSGGVTVRLPEPMMDAFTAVAGSGPAYLFYLAESLERGAVGLGFDPATARTIVRQTLVGAAELLGADGADPAGLRSAVTSKGGTTHAACTTLDDLGVMEAFASALAAARERGAELSRG